LRFNPNLNHNLSLDLNHNLNLNLSFDLNGDTDMKLAVFLGLVVILCKALNLYLCLQNVFTRLGDSDVVTIIVAIIVTIIQTTMVLL
jgi:hypothetical protein